MRPTTFLAYLSIAGIGATAAGAPPVLDLVKDQACYLSSDQVVVTVDLTDLGDASQINAGSFEMLYDRTILEYDDVAGIGGVAPFMVIGALTDVNEAAGTIFFALGSDTPTQAPQGMATITFNILNGAGCSVGDILPLVRFDPGGTETKLTDGMFGEYIPMRNPLPPITIDNEMPMIASFSEPEASVDAACEYLAEFSTTVSDNCNVALADCSFEIIGGVADLGTCGCSVAGGGTTLASISGACTISNVRECPVVIKIKVWAEDDCGNRDEFVDTFELTDDTPPTIPDVLDPVESTDTWVDVPCPFDSGNTWDNCTPFGDLLIENDRTGVGCDASDNYPAGQTTTITWTVTDECGEFSQVTQDITVSGGCIPEMEFRAWIRPKTNTRTSFPQVLIRPITFWLSDGTNCEEFCEEVEFIRDGCNKYARADAIIPVPCGDWTCLSIKDELHTLRRTISDLETIGTDPVRWNADFSGSKRGLISGDVDNDCDVDVMDFATLLCKCLGDKFPDGNTDCDTEPLHCDLSGNGRVTFWDVLIVLFHFCGSCEPACCTDGLMMLGGPDGQQVVEGPVIQIRVDTLYDQGMGEYDVADLNDDGWIDVVDIVIYLVDEKPRRPRRLP